MTGKSQARFEAALETGAAAAAPIEPGADDLDTLDPAGLCGRPFYKAVEAAGARAAAVWQPSDGHHDQPARTQDPMRDAQALAHEIEADFSGIRIRLLPADDLLSAALQDRIPDLGAGVARDVTSWFGDAVREDAKIDLANAWPDPLAAAQNAQARQYIAHDDTGTPRGTWYMVVLPASADHPRQRMEEMLTAGLEASGVEAGSGHDGRVDAADHRRRIADHELGHVVSMALGLRTAERDGLHDQYIEECRADAFEAMRRVQREGPDAAGCSDLIAKRDAFAATRGDAVHWTSPVVRAAGNHAADLARAGGFEDMRPAAMMRTCDRIARDHGLKRETFFAFWDALDAHEAGHPLDEQPDNSGRTAAYSALAGYVRTRVKDAAPGWTTGDTQAWHEALSADHPNFRRLAVLAPGLRFLETQARAVTFDLSAAPGPERDRQIARRLAPALNTAADMIAAGAENAAPAASPARQRQQLRNLGDRLERDSDNAQAPTLPEMAHASREAANVLAKSGPWLARATKEVDWIARALDHEVQRLNASRRSRGANLDTVR